MKIEIQPNKANVKEETVVSVRTRDMRAQRNECRLDQVQRSELAEVGNCTGARRLRGRPTGKTGVRFEDGEIGKGWDQPGRVLGN